LPAPLTACLLASRPLIVDQCVKYLALAFGKSIRIDLMVDERGRRGVGAAGSRAAAAAP
jgi:hypothetical protein